MAWSGSRRDRSAAADKNGAAHLHLATERDFRPRRSKEAVPGLACFYYSWVADILLLPLLVSARTFSRDESTDSRRRHRHMGTPKSPAREQRPRISLAALILDFGTRHGPIPDIQPSDRRYLRCLDSIKVEFQTLRNQAGVIILSTHSTCDHLEFDVRAKVLKLFRCPSFCAMMAIASPGQAPSAGTSYLSEYVLDRASIPNG